MRPVGLALWVVGSTACINYRPVIVDQKTAFERDLVGPFERLNEGLIVTKPATSGEPDPKWRTLLQIAIDRKLLAEQLEPLKREQAVGEGRNGQIELLNSGGDDNVRRLVAQENELRQRLFNALIRANSALIPSDEPALRRAFHATCVANAHPGERVQRDDGSWHTVTE